MFLTNRIIPKRKFPPLVPLLITTVTLWSSLCSTTILGAEINASCEWTILKEDDTLPAGLHVRMNLSTGQKMARLMDCENHDYNDDVDNNMIDISSLNLGGTAATEVSSHQVAADGTSSALSVVPNDDTNAYNNIMTPEEVQSSKKDFIMMHRTLSNHLDPEEQRAYGLPDLPDAAASDEKTVANFEEQMDRVWTARQKLLQELELADLPKILKQRIASMETYLSGGSQDNNDYADILFVLQDLEYHFGDIDMTRDFHTLGGWPLLVSLLADNVHPSTPVTTNLTSTDNGTSISAVEHRQRVQAAAAWAIGTAIKNTEEFFPWATQRVELNTSEVESITAVYLLLQRFQQAVLFSPPTTASLPLLQQKILYSLGSLLRLNVVAQRYFVSVGGPEQLAMALPLLLEGNTKLVFKLLTLASDIVREYPHGDTTTNRDIPTAFAEQRWCSAVPGLLQKEIQNQNNKSILLQEGILTLAYEMSPWCKAEFGRMGTLVESVQANVLSLNDDDIDDEWRTDILKLVDNVLLALQ